MNDRTAIEQEIRARCDTGDFRKAATLLLETYGPEILGYLMARLRDSDAASEVFSLFIEDLWCGLPRFEWRSSARVWAYALARHASSRYLKGAQRARRKNVPLSQAARLSRLEHKIRTATLPILKTEVKDRMAALRAQLSPDDQALLLLRVSRQLDWREIALIQSPPTDPADGAALDREAARLRKRFQLVKERLRKMARKEGLLDDSNETS